MKIIEGIQKTPVKVLIYGPEGIGKSSLAACFPGALTIDTEDGTGRLNIRRILCTKLWSELISVVAEIKRTPNICKTLILDTADWAEQMCIDYVCKRENAGSLAKIPWGGGYGMVRDEFKQLLDLFNDLVAMGVNIVIVAHANPRKFELPEERGQFDKWEMKLSKNVAPMLREWCDAQFFCNYQTFVITDNNGKNAKATDGKRRMIYTTHSATYDAKNRFGLPDELPMCWDSIKGILDYGGPAPIPETPAPAGPVAPVPETPAPESDTPAPAPARPVVAGIDPPPTDAGKPAKFDWHKKLHTLLEMDEITPEELMAVAVDRGKAKEGDTVDDLPDNRIAKWVYPHWEQIKAIVKANRKGL